VIYNLDGAPPKRSFEMPHCSAAGFGSFVPAKAKQQEHVNKNRSFYRDWTGFPLAIQVKETSHNGS